MGTMKNAPLSTTVATPAKRSKDKERPLVEDIRFLGRILGDVIREQEGVEAFELIEQIRTLSVAFRRDADQEADRALKKLAKDDTPHDPTPSGMPVLNPALHVEAARFGTDGSLAGGEEDGAGGAPGGSPCLRK